MSRPKKYNTKQLTNHLRQMAAEAFDMTVDGDVITRGEALAIGLWERALGYMEEKVDDEGVKTKVYHPAAAWAMQLVYDRMEGKTPPALVEDESRVTASDKVRALATARANDLARKAMPGGDSKPSGPPPHKRK